MFALAVLHRKRLSHMLVHCPVKLAKNRGRAEKENGPSPSLHVLLQHSAPTKTITFTNLQIVCVGGVGAEPSNQTIERRCNFRGQHIIDDDDRVIKKMRWQLHPEEIGHMRSCTMRCQSKLIGAPASTVPTRPQPESDANTCQPIGSKMLLNTLDILTAEKASTFGRSQRCKARQRPIGALSSAASYSFASAGPSTPSPPHLSVSPARLVAP